MNPLSLSFPVNFESYSHYNVCSEAAEKLFDLVDSFAESAKRKAAVWPLQTILLILCPEITHAISKDTVEDSKVNKVGHTQTLTHRQTHTHTHRFTLPFVCICRNCFWTVCGKLYPVKGVVNS